MTEGGGQASSPRRLSGRSILSATGRTRYSEPLESANIQAESLVCRHSQGAYLPVSCRLGRCQWSIRQRLTAALTQERPDATRDSHAERQDDQRKLRSLAGRPRRRALGDRERMANPTQRAIRCQGNRFLGTRAHPDHVSADSDLALTRDSENPAMYVGLSPLLRIRRLSRRHDLLHVSVEIREPDRR